MGGRSRNSSPKEQLGAVAEEAMVGTATATAMPGPSLKRADSDAAASLARFYRVSGRLG